MQPLSAPISDLLFLPYLIHLKCNHQFVCFSANGKGGLISRHWPNRYRRRCKTSGTKFA